MTRVAVLPDALANQIAAGEVVERPASVVKELVENALDADATTIFVDVVEGGRSLIRVLDDGSGMSAEDATLALRRHATSKLRSVDDLRAIATLGFRGEALPSIASVSRLTLTTRLADSPAATQLSVDGGGSPQVREVGARVGTRVEVRDLFYNVPARLKFLKRPATERGHITTALTDFALGYPHVHFRLTHDRRKALDCPAAPNLHQRIFQVLGRELADRLFEVRLEGSVRVLGFLSEPTTHRANPSVLHAFINGRRVRDKVVNHAVVSAYGNLLERGRYPVGVLYIFLAPDALDVNVHPAKAEVRFVDSGLVHQTVGQACRAMLEASPWSDPDRRPVHASPPAPRLRPRPGGQPDTRGADPVAAPPSPQQVLSYRPRDDDASGGRFSRLRVVGQAGGTYIVCEDEAGLTLVDQHAAHERVTFERLRAALADSKVAVQRLLIPVQLELAASDAELIRAHAEVLAEIGFELEHFGGSTWQVVGIPALLGSAAVERLLRDVLAELAEVGQTRVVQARLDDILATMACHGSVRGADPLGHEEMRALLRSLDDVDLGGSCPHGRPVAFTLSFRELEKRLERR